MLNVNGGSNAGGTFNIATTTFVTGWSSSGIINVTASGLFDFGTNLLLLGGSQTYVTASGSISSTAALQPNSTADLPSSTMDLSLAAPSM